MTETHNDERERNKIEIDTYLFVEWNQQIKLGILDKTSPNIITRKGDNARKYHLAYYYTKVSNL